MQRVFAALVLWLGPSACAHAAGLPPCSQLLAALEADPSSLHDSEPLLGVDYVVEDVASTDDTVICTGVARYRSASTHITYTAKWHDAKHAIISVNAHTTTDEEAASRARSLRIRSRPAGEDGTFLIKTDPAFCTDPDFRRRATQELQWGISVDGAFFKEPDYTIFDLERNGDATGVMANCIATVGNSKVRGEIFLGTDWVRGENGRRYAFYALDAGPDDFRIENRLWTLSAE